MVWCWIFRRRKNVSTFLALDFAATLHCGRMCFCFSLWGVCCWCHLQFFILFFNAHIHTQPRDGWRERQKYTHAHNIFRIVYMWYEKSDFLKIFTPNCLFFHFFSQFFSVQKDNKSSSSGGGGGGDDDDDDVGSINKIKLYICRELLFFSALFI